jgi:hypothetical protein
MTVACAADRWRPFHPPFGCRRGVSLPLHFPAANSLRQRRSHRTINREPATGWLDHSGGAVIKVDGWWCQCERCNYQWASTSENPPRSCSRCKDPRWNKPRVRISRGRKYALSGLKESSKPSPKKASGAAFRMKDGASYHVFLIRVNLGAWRQAAKTSQISPQDLLEQAGFTVDIPPE